MSDLRNRIQESKADFDDQELPEGHEQRFLQLLQVEQSEVSFAWWKLAAAILILIATPLIYWQFDKGSANDSLADQESSESIGEEDSTKLPLEEASFYYEQSIDQQFAALEQYYGDEDSRELIEQSKELIEELRKEYIKLESELEQTGDERVVLAMIKNYQKRIELLEGLVQKLQYIKQIKQSNHENADQNA